MEGEWSKLVGFVGVFAEWRVVLILVFMPRMQGGMSTFPPATPQKSVEVASPWATDWRLGNFEEN